jgi:acetyl esterase/lipase
LRQRASFIVFLLFSAVALTSLIADIKVTAATIKQLFLSSRQTKEYGLREDGIVFPGGMIEGFLIIDYDVEYSIVNKKSLSMDLYFPSVQDSNMPAVIYVHGGAWASGNKESGPGLLVIARLVDAGFVVAAVDYRLAPRYVFPAQIIDIKTAIRFLRKNSAVFGIDPLRIGAFGTSAGGHLVSLAGLTPGNPEFSGKDYIEESDSLAAVADLFGPADLDKLFVGIERTLAKSIFGDGEDALKIGSPVEYVSENAPPFLIVQGDRDLVVPLYQSELFYQTLLQRGNYAELLIVENAGHGFIPSGGRITPSLVEIADRVTDFFKTYLKSN